MIPLEPEEVDAILRQRSAPRLIDVPIAGLYPITVQEANRFLVLIGHRLGPCNRPFHSEAFGYELDGSLIAVAISASIVNGPVAGYDRSEVVELARLGGAVRWVNRVMLRLWREICGPRWTGWPVQAAVSYSKNAMHSGNLYRFDGWTKVREDAGQWGGSGTNWTRPRSNADLTKGPKTLWLWRYESAA
jgi:hypothetical protein